MRSRVHPTYKTKYRVANWASYDRTLVHRGDVTVWVSPAGTVKLTRTSQAEGRMTEGSGCCDRGPHGKRSGSQQSMMHRAQAVATHAKQILNEAVHLQEALGVVG